MKKLLITLFIMFTTAVSASAETTADNNGADAADTLSTSTPAIVSDAPSDAPSDADATPEPSAAPTVSPVPQEPEENVVLALDTSLMCVNGSVQDKQYSPYMYSGITYVPVRAVSESLGAEVVYDGDTRTVSILYKNNGYGISTRDDKVFLENGVTYVPLRELCNYIGVTINWYNGVITLADDGYELDTGKVNYYTDLLLFGGYSDRYIAPATIVNPRVKYSYDQMVNDINALHRMYPKLIRDIHSIGSTTEGRDIPAFYLGKGDVTIIICASMHAREHIATNVIMYLTDHYARCYANDIRPDGYDIRKMLNDFSFLIVPMVNPDGINLVQNGFESTQSPEYLSSLPQNGYGARGWKATATGVDLNNNFDLLWHPNGSGPASAGYGGPYAASEPETRAMQDLINNTDFPIFVSLHTQGQVIYWMDPISESALYDKHSPIVSEICNEFGFEKMGSSGSTSYSGYMTDYVRYYKGAMALTIELCPYVGDYPYPESDFDTVAYPVRNLCPALARAYYGLN